MDIYRYFSGYCPYLEKEREIEIRYSSVNALRMGGDYKINNVVEPCEYDEDCPHLDKWNRCPIYAKAPVEIKG